MTQTTQAPRLATVRGWVPLRVHMSGILQGGSPGLDTRLWGRDSDARRVLDARESHDGPRLAAIPSHACPEASRARAPSRARLRWVR